MTANHSPGQSGQVLTLQADEAGIGTVGIILIVILLLILFGVIGFSFNS